VRNKSLTSISLLILFATFTSTVYPFPKDTLCVLGISSGDHLAYSPNGRILAMTDREMVFLLDAQTFIQLGVLMDEADRPDDNVESIAFSPDGLTLVSGHDDGMMTVWDVRQMRKTLSFRAHEADRTRGSSGTVSSLAYHPGGDALASAGDDGIIKLWDASTWKELTALNGHADGVSSIAFDLGGKFLASGGYDGIVRIWDVAMNLSIEAGPVLHTQGYIQSLVISVSDRLTVAFTSVDRRTEGRSVKLWTVKSGSEPAELQADGTILGPIFEPDGETVVTAGDRVRFWDVGSGEMIQTLSRHSESDVIALHPDGRTLASVKQSQPLRVWDVVTEELKYELPAAEKSILLDFRFDDDGEHIVCAMRRISPRNQINIQRWRIGNGTNISSDILGGIPPSGFINAGFFSPDGDQFMGSLEGKLYRWSLPEVEFLTPFDIPGGPITHSFDGTIAIGDSQGEIHLFNSDTGTRKGMLHGHSSSIQSLAFGSDGWFLASGDSDGIIVLWDVTMGDQVAKWSAHEKWFTDPRDSGVLSLAFDSHSHLLASGGGSGDNTVKLWDVADGGELLETLVGHETLVESLDFSLDGEYLASSGQTSDWSDSVILWDVESGEPLWTIGYGTDMLRFDPAGKQIAMRLGSYILVWKPERLIGKDSVAAVSTGVQPVIWGRLRRDFTSFGFMLLPNYPNPSNPETWIPYQLGEDANVTIRIHNAAGQLVKTLDFGHRPVGFYTTMDKAAYWDGTNEHGEKVTSGVYYYSIYAGDFSDVRKLVLVE
jgi:WD40 repeat protein